MEKALFALSLGFAGVILATHAGWSHPAFQPQQAAACPQSALTPP
jgi:hypothetical protein